jgi:hypothetical protein
VNYRGFNKITVKNRYLFFLVGEILDRFSGVAVYTKLDLKNAYYRIRIRERDEWKTAFRIKYGYFEYKMILFGLVNAPAIFQAYINKALAGFININYVTYLDDIFIYFSIYAEYQRYIRSVRMFTLIYVVY